MQFFNLADTTRSDQDRGDLWLAQDPGHRQLREALASLPGQSSQPPSTSKCFLVNVLRFQKAACFTRA
jgi:hypothetical protein